MKACSLLVRHCAPAHRGRRKSVHGEARPSVVARARKEETMGTLDVRSMVRAMYDAWNAKDLERVVAYAHPDCRVTNVAFGSSLSFKDYEQNWATAFPDGSIE